MTEFFGKYRGTVSDNKDPLKRGRLAVTVPAISEHPLRWAMPSTPYAGPKLGWYAMPPAGAHVWVEFEAGNINYPIWSGCFWTGSDQDAPPEEATEPEIKVLKTEKMTVILDDKTVKFTAKVETDSGIMKIEIDKKGIILTADQVTITLATDKIELKKTPATITVADAIKLEKAAASVTVSDTIALKNASASVEIAASSIDLKNGGSSVALSPATVNINNGALEVM
jgi:uncharacterized protein involved in type VI secretion and phage assembly